MPMIVPPAFLVSGTLPIVLGFFLDQLLGDPPGWPHPVRWIGRLIGWLERVLRPYFPERLGGIFLLLFVVFITAAAVIISVDLADRVHPLFRLILATVLIWWGLASRSLADETQAVLAACREENWPTARVQLSRIVGRDTEDLAPEEIYRACIETVAENTSDGIIAPLFYAALFGPAGMWVYKAINTLDSMVGYRNEKYRRFGWASARADDVANFIPARLTWLLLSLAAGRRAGRALSVGWREGNRHPSPNAGWPEAAMAGALAVQLGGPSSYGGVVSDKPLLGDAEEPLTVAKVERSIRIMRNAAWLALLVALMLAGGWFANLGNQGDDDRREFSVVKPASNCQMAFGGRSNPWMLSVSSESSNKRSMSSLSIESLCISRRPAQQTCCRRSANRVALHWHLLLRD
jgi:adenosylcobinamide-phosphate synthase